MSVSAVYIETAADALHGCIGETVVDVGRPADVLHFDIAVAILEPQRSTDPANFDVGKCVGDGDIRRGGRGQSYLWNRTLLGDPEIDVRHTDISVLIVNLQRSRNVPHRHF